MVRPLASNRPRTSPTRPRRTVSGLSRTRVRCDMSVLSPMLFRRSAAAEPNASAGSGLGGLGVVDPAAEHDRGHPEPGEGDAEHEHDRYDEAESDRGDL